MLKILYTTVSDKKLMSGVGRSLLKQLAPEDEVIYNKNGKPYFKNIPLFFSISHSYPYVVCGVSDREIGIDAEAVRNVSSKAAGRVFTEGEIKLLESGADFLKLWTAKESVIKAIGGSVIADCKKVDIASLSECEADGKRLYIQSVDIPGCVCFIASADKYENIEIVKIS
jgi:4'-phosphopantetheinyl transferase